MMKYVFCQELLISLNVSRHSGEDSVAFMSIDVIFSLNLRSL